MNKEAKKYNRRILSDKNLIKFLKVTCSIPGDDKDEVIIDLANLNLTGYILDISNLKADIIYQSNQTAKKIYQSDHRAKYIVQNKHFADEIKQDRHTAEKIDQENQSCREIRTQDLTDFKKGKDSFGHPVYKYNNPQIQKYSYEELVAIVGHEFYIENEVEKNEKQ